MKECKYFEVCGNYCGGHRHLECSQCATIRKRYGITLEDRNAIYEEQGGCCAVCMTPVMFYNTAKENPEEFQRACVDHCHKSGEVRGILCHSCNVSLGLVKDNIETLVSMISYLNR